ncbi:hypothetical protein V8B55DRAFT_1351582 [Mucor lusitanicus]|uniref:FYVE-type domain-containing protein n=1 Tax=Mucor circinelloides f. lusitanicus TaxID=29924 RepID=A0A8H4BI76_MUCCL|nr:hypothetical protein FB192DRAFT_1436010 [Mucor lusitanicus]
MANLLLQLDQTSKDSLYTTDTLTNDSKQWLMDTQHNDDDDIDPSLSHPMHVNVTEADKCSFSSPTNKVCCCSHNNRYSSYQRYESPFPYNSSLNYYYNAAAAAAITTTSRATATATTITYNEDNCYMDFQGQVMRNRNHQKPFDPHIDDFDVVRAKVTGITRAMQQYHVDELEQEHQPLLSPVASSINTASIDQLDASSIRPLSPLSILCPTTNSLVQSRVLEEMNDDEYQLEDEQAWHAEFLNLMSTLISHSESLESISTDLLRTEGKVRELVLLQKSMLEEYEEREKLYRNRLDECEQVAQQQQQLMDHLVELDRDLDLTAHDKSKTSKSNRQWMTLSATTSTTTTTTTLSTIYRWQSSEQSRQPRNRRSTYDSCSSNSLCTLDHPCQQQWDFNQPVRDIIQISSMQDLVHTLRWEVGLWIGGGVGTGHVIHSFEGPLNGIEMIIAGSGTIATAAATNELASSSSSAATRLAPSSMGTWSDDYTRQESFTLSSSIQHLRFHRHHYMLHINRHDRTTQFKLLPKNQWVPDQQSDQCQFKTATAACITRFNLFQRRHHCRRCGILVCQRHSLNRLPLFASIEPIERWHRVCDGCFYDLIINKKQQAFAHDSAADLTEIC